MNKHLYAYLDEWAKNNKVSFKVDHEDRYHLLKVTHYIKEAPKKREAIVRFVMVYYYHDGGKDVVTPWAMDDTIANFIELAEMFWTAIPKQPCSTLGYRSGE